MKKRNQLGRKKKNRFKSFLLLNINQSMPIYDKIMEDSKNAGKHVYR